MKNRRVECFLYFAQSYSNVRSKNDSNVCVGKSFFFKIVGKIETK